MKFILLLAPLLASSIIASIDDEGDKDDYYLHRTKGALKSKNIGNEIIYQIVVDRFRNGNPKNDCVYDKKFCARGNKLDWFRYLGGDLEGVIQSLDYLKNLGVSRLWLTPIFENAPFEVVEKRGVRDFAVTSYHGYWIRDWFKLNPYFTNKGPNDFATVDRLIKNAGKQGIKIYLDTVANHTSPTTPTKASLAYLNKKEPLAKHQSHVGALFENGKYLMSYPHDVKLKTSKPRYQPWFHHFGRIGDNDWNDPFKVENYSLMGLADLDQKNQKVYDYFIRAHEFWLKRGIAGYRIDTIKHINHSYWKKFSKDLYQKHPNSENFGEYFGGGPSHKGSIKYFRETRFSMFDFDLRNAMRNVFLLDKSFEEITDVWAIDPKLGDARSLITFLDSHDLKRIRGEGLSYKRMRLAIVLWLMSRGVPCIYYGLEQDLFVPNDPGDPYNRPMMRHFRKQRSNYPLVAVLNSLRRNNEALRYGTTHVVHQTKNILAFERLYKMKKVFVALSKNKAKDKFKFSKLTFPDGFYTDVISKKRYRISGGRMNIEMNYGSVIVLSK